MRNRWLLAGAVFGVWLRGYGFLLAAAAVLIPAYLLFRMRMMGAGDGKLMALIAGYLGLDSGMKAIGAGMAVGAIWSLCRIWHDKTLLSRFTYLNAYIRRTIHTKEITDYQRFVPGAEPEEMPEPGEEPESEEAPESGEAPEPEEAPEPGRVLESGEAPEPGKVPESEEAPESEKVPGLGCGQFALRGRTGSQNIIDGQWFVWESRHTIPLAACLAAGTYLYLLVSCAAVVGKEIL